MRYIMPVLAIFEWAKMSHAVKRATIYFKINHARVQYPAYMYLCTKCS